MLEHIKVSCEAGIVTITLNRPERLNAFAGHMRRDLAEVLERAGSDPRIRVVVITGAGQAFCAGGDVEAIAELMERRDTDEFARLLGAGRRVVTAIRQMPKPVIASIPGPAAGAGCNLALACDIRLAARSATFTQSFVRLGLHPDWGGTYFLPRIVPPNIACEMFFLGETITAEEAWRFGLVNRVFPDEELEAETRRFAERLRDAPPAVITAAKHAVYMSDHATLDQMLQYELESQLRCFQTQDAREGVRAFLERRAPRFTGH
ncbi:enoyl-CoA hydratase/isomerase family protein [Pyrinomonas methylaliphatogenes]|uniref:Enoyl-CoA hydratase/carnithine racemase n=1 Tax=Pyrinomonas methylaliphatogenes TaxID=454194 RepID=A0A0B6X372_9BACT|nr:enoyl-CoA hydratase [Pyrinomonas methylaliphatogenes]CDM66964.1 enoyl-CoA hydratase/carnithine racemase [Pyrinomonas methylaliphatogenes]